MGETMVKLTPEQEEILDSGLRMLAHMIAETHLRRIALKKQNKTVTQSLKTNRCAKKKKLSKMTDDNSAGGHDE